MKIRTAESLPVRSYAMSS